MPNKDRQEEKRICEDIIRALDKPHRLIEAEELLKTIMELESWNVLCDQ